MEGGVHCSIQGAKYATVWREYPEGETSWTHIERFIADLAMSYGGYIALRLSRILLNKMYLRQQINNRPDCSMVDQGINIRHFTGHHVVSCNVRGSFSHTVKLCVNNAIQARIKGPLAPRAKRPMGKPTVWGDGLPQSVSPRIRMTWIKCIYCIQININFAKHSTSWTH